MDPSAARKLRRLRTLGRRALCVVVWLASDDASGQFLPVKSAGAAGEVAAQLWRMGAHTGGALLVVPRGMPRLVRRRGRRAWPSPRVRVRRVTG